MALSKSLSTGKSTYRYPLASAASLTLSRDNSSIRAVATVIRLPNVSMIHPTFSIDFQLRLGTSDDSIAGTLMKPDWNPTKNNARSIPEPDIIVIEYRCTWALTAMTSGLPQSYNPPRCEPARKPVVQHTASFG
jgi:hypothetical protein